MSLDQLLFEVTHHYRGRGFSERAIRHLRWVLVAHTQDGKLNLVTEFPKCTRPVDELLGKFKPCGSAVATDGERGSAQAVFGFAFGYRMADWPNDRRPTEPEVVARARRPGKNNKKLAKIALELRKDLRLPLYLQFEIADCISEPSKVEYQSPRQDLNTLRVLEAFKEHASGKGTSLDKVVVVCHRHHFERCRLLLADHSITGLPPHRWYCRYDRKEAQPRVMSPEESIVNDFASMAGMKRPADRN